MLNMPIPRENTFWKETLSEKVLHSKTNSCSNSNFKIKEMAKPKQKSDENVKSQTCSSLFKNPDAALREAELEEVWGIWKQPHEVHSFDYNIELMTMIK